MIILLLYTYHIDYLRKYIKKTRTIDIKQVQHQIYQICLLRTLYTHTRSTKPKMMEVSFEISYNANQAYK